MTFKLSTIDESNTKSEITIRRAGTDTIISVIGMKVSATGVFDPVQTCAIANELLRVGREAMLVQAYQDHEKNTD